MTQTPLLPPQVRHVPLADLPTTTEGAANHLGGTLRSTGQIDPILLEEHPDGTYTIG